MSVICVLRKWHFFVFRHPDIVNTCQQSPIGRLLAFVISGGFRPEPKGESTMLALQVYAPALLNLGKSVFSVSSFYSLLTCFLS